MKKFTPFCMCILEAVVYYLILTGGKSMITKKNIIL